MESLCVKLAMCITMSATPITTNNLFRLPGNSPLSVQSSNNTVFKEDMPVLLNQPDLLAALDELDPFDCFVGEMGKPVMRTMSCVNIGDRGSA